MRVRVGWDAVVPILLLLYADLYTLAAGYLIAVGVHELGHLAAIRLLGGRVDSVHFGASGGVILYHGIRSYTGELVVSLSGAAGNIFAAVTLSLLGKYGGLAVLYPYAGINLTQAAFNLMPVFPLDGGNAVHTVLSFFASPGTADRIMKRLGFLISFVFVGLGVYILIKTRYNGTMLLCGCSLLSSALWENGGSFRRKKYWKNLRSRG